MKRIEFDDGGCPKGIKKHCVDYVNYDNCLIDAQLESCEEQVKDDYGCDDCFINTQLKADKEATKDKITPEEAIFLLCGIGVDSGCSKCPNETLCCSNKTEIIYKNIEAKLKQIVGGKK